MRIVLPWPDKRLTPNAKRRKHWSYYRPAEKADRKTGATLACVSIALRDKRALAAIDGKIPMIVTFFPPDARKRDDDGMIAAFKHMRDGIADALGVDDNRFMPAYVIAEPGKPGRVEVQFSPPVDKKEAPLQWPESGDSSMEMTAPESAANAQRGLTQSLSRSDQDAA